MRHAHIYRKIIEAMPAGLIDGLDNQLTTRKATRWTKKEMRGIAHQVRKGDTWYALDGSGGYYRFTGKGLKWDECCGGFTRWPITYSGLDPVQMYQQHGCDLSPHRPAGFVSAATLAAASYGGLDGDPVSWGWRDDPATGLDIAQAMEIRRNTNHLPAAYRDAMKRAERAIKAA